MSCNKLPFLPTSCLAVYPYVLCDSKEEENLLPLSCDHGLTTVEKIDILLLFSFFIKLIFCFKIIE